MENTRFFGYVRVSTAGQVKRGFSLEQQKEEIGNFCEENNYKGEDFYFSRARYIYGNYADSEVGKMEAAQKKEDEKKQ